MTGSIQVNKGKWYCVLNMKDEYGKRKLKWFSTGLPEKGNKRAAKEKLEQLIQKYGECNTLTRFADMSFSNYCDYWLEHKKQSLEITTYEGYEIRIKHIQEYFEPKKTALSKVTSRDIKLLYEYLLREGNRSKYKKDKGLSERTVKEISLLVKAVFRDPVVFGDIPNSPAENIEVPKKRRTNVKKGTFIDSNDLKYLKAAVKCHILAELILITLVYGLRRSEVLGLRWSAINFEKNTLEINHTVVKVKKQTAKDTAKTEASYRTYPLSEYTTELLLKVKERQDLYRKLLGKEYHESDYVFTWQDGRCFSTDYITKTFKKIVKKEENLSSELTFHDLRKSCVSMMVEDGYNVKEIQEWVGHTDVKTTLDIYAKVKETRKNYIAVNMGEKFKNIS